MQHPGIPGAAQHAVVRCRPEIPVFTESKQPGSRICDATLRAASHAGHLIFLVGILLLVSASVAHAAGNISAGRQKALQCQTCHGLDGLSKLPDAPNIAGSPEQYLARQLNAFRKGERRNEMMSLVVQPLSDQDVADLAAYYAAIEVTVKLPPR